MTSPSSASSGLVGFSSSRRPSSSSRGSFGGLPSAPRNESESNGNKLS